MKITKFDRLMKVYSDLATELKSIENELVKAILDSWSKSFKQMDSFLQTKEVQRSQMNSGLEQGLRDLPDLFSDLPQPEKDRALSILMRVVNAALPGFYKKR